MFDLHGVWDNDGLLVSDLNLDIATSEGLEDLV